jgi:hypothetical protein
MDRDRDGFGGVMWTDKQNFGFSRRRILTSIAVILMVGAAYQIGHENGFARFADKNLTAENKNALDQCLLEQWGRQEVLFGS